MLKVASEALILSKKATEDREAALKKIKADPGYLDACETLKKLIVAMMGGQEGSHYFRGGDYIIVPEIINGSPSGKFSLLICEPSLTAKLTLRTFFPDQFQQTKKESFERREYSTRRPIPTFLDTTLIEMVNPENRCDLSRFKSCVIL